MSTCNREDCVNGWIFDPETNKALDRCRVCDPDYVSPEERDRIRREEREVKARRAEKRRRAELGEATKQETEELRGSLPYKD